MNSETHDVFLQSLQERSAEAADLMIEEYTRNIPHRMDAADFLDQHALKHTKFSHHIGLADAYRDQKQWLLGFSQYRLALGYLPGHAGYHLHAGHCLKEAELFEAAEAYYRSALLLGEQYENVAPHLLFCCYRNRFQETNERLIQQSERVRDRTDTDSIRPTIDDLWRLVETLGLEREITAEDILSSMRRDLSGASALSELALRYWTVIVGGRGRAVDLPGFPTIEPPEPSQRRSAGAHRLRANGTSIASHWIARQFSSLRSLIVGSSNKQYKRPVVLRLRFSRTVAHAAKGGSKAGSHAVDIRNLVLKTSKDLIAFDFSRENATKSCCVAYGYDPNYKHRLRSVGKEVVLLIWLSAPEDPLTVDMTSEVTADLTSVECSITTTVGHSGSVTLMESGDISTIVQKGTRTALGDVAFDAVSKPVPSTNVSLLETQKPKVSIIIINKNRPCLSLISMLSTNCISSPFEIILVENGSGIKDRTPTRHAPPHKRIDLSVNQQFGGANNAAAKIARGDFLLLLNNDAVVTLGMVESMLLPFYSDPVCGVVGPIFRYPDGLLQEAGSFVDEDGNTTQRGKFDADFSVSALPIHSKVDYVSGACLLVRRDTFVSVGGFDQRFELFGYYDDVDICMRIQRAKLQIVLARDALCYHVEGATGMIEERVPNGGRLMFLSLWREYLSVLKSHST